MNDVLTRPLGATLGDVLTKPHADGGLALSRISSSLVIGVVMIIGIIITTWRVRRVVDPVTTDVRG